VQDGVVGAASSAADYKFAHLDFSDAENPVWSPLPGAVVSETAAYDHRSTFFVSDIATAVAPHAKAAAWKNRMIFSLVFQPAEKSVNAQVKNNGVEGGTNPAMIGGIIGAALLVIAILLGVICYLQRYKKLWNKTEDLLKKYSIDDLTDTGPKFGDDDADVDFTDSAIAGNQFGDLIQGDGASEAELAAAKEKEDKLKADIARLKKDKMAEEEEHGDDARRKHRKKHKRGEKTTFAATQVGSGDGAADMDTAAAAAGEGIADGWEEFMDDKTGKKYYYNATTKQTTWSKPTE
jgi:hypothetical protein